MDKDKATIQQCIEDFWGDRPEQTLRAAIQAARETIQHQELRIEALEGILARREAAGKPEKSWEELHAEASSDSERFAITMLMRKEKM